MAVSDDGLHWERLWKGPFVKAGRPGEWNSSESGHPHIYLDRDGRTYLFFQGNNKPGLEWYITNIEIVWEDGIPKIAE